MATAVTQVPTGQEVHPAKRALQALETRKGQIAAALAGRVDPDAFIRVAHAAVTKSPKLMECTTDSLMMALMECATLGLTPNGVLGEAYIVPFNNKIKEGNRERWEVQAQFIPGFRGLIKLARQSGVIRNIVPRVVRVGDLFELEQGLEDRLRHVPDLDGDEGRPLTHVYAVAHYTDGTTQFEVMSKKAVDKIRARSKSKDFGPWVTDYDAMAVKTVIRRLVKYLPLSDFDLARAIEADNRDFEDSPALASASRAAALPVSRTAGLIGRLGGGSLPSTPEPAGADFTHSEVVDTQRGEVTRAQPQAPAGTDDVPPPDDTHAPAAADAGALHELLAAARSLQPGGRGARAEAGQRTRLQAIASRVVMPHADEDDAALIGIIAGDETLTREQARTLINLGALAAEELGVSLSDGAPEADRSAPASRPLF